MLKPWMYGLLGNQAGPQGGLLGPMGQLAQLAANSESGPRLPLPTPAIRPAPQVIPRPIPGMIPTPRKVSRETPGPILSPALMGLAAGGIAAGEASPGSYYTGSAPVIAAALRAGLPAYIAGKQAQQEAALTQQDVTDFRSTVEGMVSRGEIPPAAGKLAISMARSNLPGAQKAIQTVLEEQGKAVTTPEGAITTVGGKTITNPRTPVTTPEEKNAAAALGLDLQHRGTWTPEQQQDFQGAVAAATTPRIDPNNPDVLAADRAFREKLAKDAADRADHRAQMEATWAMQRAKLQADATAANKAPPKTPAADQMIPAQEAYDEVQGMLEKGYKPTLKGLQAAAVAIEPQSHSWLKRTVAGFVASDADLAYYQAQLRLAEAEQKARPGGRGPHTNSQRAMAIGVSRSATKAAFDAISKQAKNEGFVSPSVETSVSIPAKSRADRWEELVKSGMSPAAATAKVKQEMP